MTLRKFIWIGIVLGLAPLCMGAACGGYEGWPGLTTNGGDSKVTFEWHCAVWRVHL